MTDTREHPYAEFLGSVLKPGRYLGGENGQTDKSWDDVSARICLAFPDVYEVGMSHLGFKILYSLINREDDLLAERAYAPWVDMEAALRKHEPAARRHLGHPNRAVRKVYWAHIIYRRAACLSGRHGAPRGPFETDTR
jgi:hypothetical protein